MLLHYLQAAIWNRPTPTPPPTEAEWRAMQQEAALHGVLPLIYDRLLPQVDKTVGVPMKQVCLRNMLLQEHWEQLIRKTVDVLEAGGVHCVLLKGFGLAALYPKPYLRSWGDADIWVGVEQYHQACGLLRAAFPECKHHDEEWDDLKHYNFVFPDGLAIELHRVAMDFVSRRDARYWQTIEKQGLMSGPMLSVGGREVQIPEDGFNQLFIFLHAWEHFRSTGMPLKQVCDMALLARTVQCRHADDAVWLQERDTNLRRQLKALHLGFVWQLVGYVVIATTGLDASDWPLYRETPLVRHYGKRVLQRMMSEGDTRHFDETLDQRAEARERARQMPLLLRKMRTLRERIRSFAFLYHYAPAYALHEFGAMLAKGIRRTLKNEAMINY